LCDDVIPCWREDGNTHLRKYGDADGCVGACGSERRTGKTTICANLAVEAEACGHGPVALIDVDPQGTLSKWWNRRQAESPTLVEINVAEIETQLHSLAARGMKLVVVDTPGAITSHVRTVIRTADLVLIPSRPSILDIETLYDFCDVVEAEGRPMTFVLNAVKPKTRISSDAIRGLSGFGTVAPTELVDRVDYSGSFNDGRSAAELVSGGKAGQEIRELWQYVSARLRKRVHTRIQERST